MSEAGDALDALLALMRRLRDPDRGCPWDRAQDFASIVPHTIEEAYEVEDAAVRGDLAALRDELGDLLFQVVFLAQIASEQGKFDFAQVARAVTDKLRRRHPHVFGPGEADVDGAGNGGAADWEQHKRQERQARGQAGTLAGVASALPALSRAAKLGKRAAAVGFDWQDHRGAAEKVREELAEVLAAEVGGGEAERQAEIGDLLMSVTSLARHLQVDPELALREANRRFESRFAAMESAAASRGWRLADLDAGTWDALWNSAKNPSGGG